MDKKVAYTSFSDLLQNIYLYNLCNISKLLKTFILHNHIIVMNHKSLMPQIYIFKCFNYKYKLLDNDIEKQIK